MSAKLYVVATPIGNLNDITFRAIEVLKSVSLVAVEDTRQAKKLWVRFGINTRMQICNKDNEYNVTDKILKILQDGNDVALISDAGTPLIHDPGSMLVAKAAAMGCVVIPIPGACALVAALSVAGFDASNFIYCGFPPQKKSILLSELESLKFFDKTLVFYEAPHRIKKTLQAMLDIFGCEREVVIAREITKLHEEFVRGTLKFVLDNFENGTLVIKGEFVIVVKGYIAKDNRITNLENEAMEIFVTEALKKLTVKDVVSLTTIAFKQPQNTVYDMCLSIKNRSS
ncbi:MAG: 16S rRNA (cytidine(1402)-2'-O)-methyltransferase [Pseudomonadota bacterium]|nr:16S rRNA (cytidine(1402)-2'-O)-methyltransferase [Pseudomonadota bacterium]